MIKTERAAEDAAERITYHGHAIVPRSVPRPTQLVAGGGAHGGECPLARPDGPVSAVARTRVLLTAALTALEGRRHEINYLNVYPVPDGDTGTNLVLTMRGILEQFDRMPQNAGRKKLAQMVSTAALMSARGNSGVILSQMIRGAMEVVAADADGHLGDECLLAAALRHATDSAYRAVRIPVEGTMLTVLREMAEAAAERQACSTIVERVVEAGRVSVRRTPSLLRVLAEAGVVDAGGYGILVLFEGLFKETVSRESFALVAGMLAAARSAEMSRHICCTSFLISGKDLDRTILERLLDPLGDSLLVVGDERQTKIHVHTDDPQRVLEIGREYGGLSEIEIDNLSEQIVERSRMLEWQAQRDKVELTQVVAVIAGEGNRRLYRSLGTDLLVEGSQPLNPSAEELLEVVGQARAPGVIILPNNRNVARAAEQAAGLTDHRVLVVPTQSMAAGLSALLALDPEKPVEDNFEAMTQAISSVMTGEVTRAARDSAINGKQIQEGAFVGLVEGEVVATALELEEVLQETADRLVEGTRDVLTVLLGRDDLGRLAATAANNLNDRYPELTVEIHDGGQPFYPVLLAAE